MLTQSVAERVIDKALGSGADFCEIFAEDRKELSIKYEDGRCTNASRVNLYGAGVHLLRGTASIYVYTSDLTERGLMTLLDRAAAFLPGDCGGAAQPFRMLPAAEPNPVRIYPGSVALQPKTALLAETERALRAAVKADYHAEYTYFDTDQRIIVAASDGTWAEDHRVTTRLRDRFSLSNGRESTGSFVDFTRPMGFEAYENGGHIRKLQRDIQQWEESLTADEAPKGRFPVVFEGGSCVGTFFHEACGHQLEAGHLIAENAFFRDKLGQRVASEKVTLIDDGSLPGQYGSSKFDDEGMPRQPNILIEKGILKSFLVDRMGARRLGVGRTASGRRENYTYAPAARMSNTYLAAGDDDPDEMIREIDHGILVTAMGGGSGGAEFTLECPRAYLIRNGQIDRLLKNVMLVGRGDETMMKIDRVSNRMVWEDGGSFCGADSGLVNTTTSGARMRVAEMVVG